MKSLNLVLLALLLPSLAVSLASAASFTPDEADGFQSCSLPLSLKNPLTGKNFQIEELFNKSRFTEAGLENRYVVVDLDTVDANGMCRGAEEEYPHWKDLEDFGLLKPWFNTLESEAGLLEKSIPSSKKSSPKEIAQKALVKAVREHHWSTEEEKAVAKDLANYLERVQISYNRTTPMKRGPWREDVEYDEHYDPKTGELMKDENGKVIREAYLRRFCIGQTISMCELRNGQPYRVAKFITSAARYFDGRKYYPELATLPRAYWGADWDKPYQTQDLEHDTRMGWNLFAKKSEIVKFRKSFVMPYFVGIQPAPGFFGSRQNGFHRIALGDDKGGAYGAAVSHGCLRLREFPASFFRWWTPKDANAFFYYTGKQERVVRYSDKNGKGTNQLILNEPVGH